jgi:hypothetical protein
MSFSACSLSSMKVLTPQQCGTHGSAAYHHALVIKSPVMLAATSPLSRGPVSSYEKAQMRRAMIKMISRFHRRATRRRGR